MPNASESFLKRNAQDCADSKPPCPEPKRPLCNDPVAEAPREESHYQRVIVRITSFRRKFLDPDNLIGGSKYFTDGLRYAGLISGDAEAQIRLEVSQQKVSSKAAECTRIEIIPLDQPPGKTRAQLIEQYWATCQDTWNRPAFDAFMETLGDDDLRHYITLGKE
jgi:hypothetical protein